MLNFTKGKVLQGIEAYQFKKFSKFTEECLTPSEKSIILPFAYFISQPVVKTVYDIGAAKGAFSSAVSKFRNIKEVVAFEPLPSSYKQLGRAIDGLDKVASYNVAIGETGGELRFRVTADGDSSSCLMPNESHAGAFPGRAFQGEISVRVETLDAMQEKFRFTRPDLIKIDTQGFELQVLRGAKACLRTARFVVLECSYVPLYAGGPLINDVCDYFSSLGWWLVGAGPQIKDAVGQPLQVDLVFSREKSGMAWARIR